MDKARVLSVTKEYYSQFLGVEPAALDRPGVSTCCCTLRDICQKGYPHPFSLYCWMSGPTVIVSYSKSIQASIPAFVNAFVDHCASEKLVDKIATLHPSLGHGRKFVFNELPDKIETSQAVRLYMPDYPAYLSFFLEQHPQSDKTDWLRPYFNSLVDRELVFGVFKDDILVSATDAPDMPFMGDKVAEIGINTLDRYRGQGHGRSVVTALTKHLIGKGIVPMWSCDASNEASRALAISVGFKEMSETLYG
jgi:hypothetical protein